MRPLMLALGLVLGAQTTAAEVQDPTYVAPSTHVVLNNGCVYVENSFAPGNEWSLLYSQTGTPGLCALTIYGTTSVVTEYDTVEDDLIDTAFAAPAVVTRTQTTPVTVTPKRPRKPQLRYLTGAFR